MNEFVWDLFRRTIQSSLFEWTVNQTLTLSAVELLMSHCPLVERLGFDENFMDVTEIVERRLKETSISDLSFIGHVYKHECELEPPQTNTNSFKSIGCWPLVADLD